MGMNIGIKLGEKSWLKRRADGGFYVLFEWFDNDRDELGTGDPTLFIVRERRSALSGNRGAIAIPMAHAHQHADSRTGGPTAYSIAFAAQGCEELGIEPSKQNVRKLVDAIVDNLPDLIRMPPEPSPHAFASRKARPLGEITVLSGGKAIAEHEIH